LKSAPLVTYLDQIGKCLEKTWQKIYVQNMKI
jgi:hypothetical protein